MILDLFNLSPPIWQNILLLISIVVTGSFSFFVLRVSNETKEVSKNMKVIEEQRDNEKNIKSSVIIYYDIKTMVEYLVELIMAFEKGNEASIQSKILIDDMWIQHLAVLRKVLSRTEVDYIRNLFSEISNLNLKTMDVGKKHELKTDLEKIKEKYLVKELLNNVNLTQTKIQPLEIINYELFIILSKIYLETLNENEIQKQRIKKKKGFSITLKILGNFYYRGNSEEIFKSSFSVYDEIMNKLKLKGTIENGKFSGSYYGYDGSLDLYIFEYFQGDLVGKKIINNNYIDYAEVILDEKFMLGVWEGISTVFNGDLRFKKVRSHGSYKNYKLHGDGYQRSGKITYKGLWEDGVILNGQLIEEKRVVFTGEFRNGMPYSGYAINYDLNEIVTNFTGDLREGMPFNGEGLEFLTDKMNHTVEDLYFFKEVDEYFTKEEEEKQNDDAYQKWQEEGYREQERAQSRYWATYTNAKWKDGEIIEKGDEGITDSYKRPYYEQYWDYKKN